MKVVFILLAIAFFVPVHSQWTSNGVTMYSANTGNVGIGTSTPGNKLQVTGNASIGDAFDATSYGQLQIARPSNQLDNRFHLSFIKSGAASVGMGYGLNSSLFGFWYAGNNAGTPLLAFTSTQRVGIGTSTPTAPLSVASSSANLIADFKSSAAANSWVSIGNSVSYMNLGVGTTSPHPYIWSLTDQFFIGSDATVPTLYVKGMSNGNVGIGTTNPGTYKLAVEGTLGARKIKVTQAAWADFVFEKGYELPTLDQVQAFINQHGHLPNIPSADEVEKNGIDVGENQKLLLQKIEELTLYIIEQKTQLDSQKKIIEKLSKRIDALETTESHF